MPMLAFASLVGLICPILSDFSVGSEGVLVWLVDLAAHWQWLFLIGLFIAAAKLTWGDPRWGILFLAAPLPYLTASAQAPRVSEVGSAFTVVSANVSIGNREPSQLIEWISEQQADVVALFEVSPEFAAVVGVEVNFPFQEIVPGGGPFGIAVISRHPMRDVEVIRDEDGIAHIMASLEWQRETLTVVAIHPMPPIDPHYQFVRDTKLRSLAKKADEQGRPSIVVGDINATPWSSAFSGLGDRGLRRATGLVPSWPAALGGLMGIPIDHVLVTDHWGWVGTEIGPDFGSDHFPVVARLVLNSATTRH